MDTYNNELLYCNGRFKPYMRGKIHFLGIFILPLFYLQSINFINVLTLIIFEAQFIISSLYHIINHKYKNEILLQYLDHISIFWSIFGGSTYLLYNSGYYIPIIINLFVNIYINTIYNVWNLRLIGSYGLLNFILLFNYYKINYGIILNLILHSSTILTIYSEYPLKKNKFFGYHEISHICILLAFCQLTMINI